jgi:Ribbon-helix-helix protein, copG family
MAGWYRYGKGDIHTQRSTVKEIRRTAERLGRPQSQVIREAVAEYAARADQVPERERLHESEEERAYGVLGFQFRMTVIGDAEPSVTAPGSTPGS